MSNNCVGRIQIFDVGDHIFLTFQESEELRQRYRLICSSFYHSKSGEESNVLPFLPVILLSEQVQVLVENGFAQICHINTPIKGRESYGNDKIEENNFKMNNKEEENLMFLARKILIGRNLKKRKRALLGTNVPSTLLKIRKIDYLSSNDESVKINNENEGFEDEELQTIISELRLRNVHKMASSTRNSTSYGLPSTFYNFFNDLPDFPQNAEYLIKLTVFRDLWRKGFYLLSGTKFGCDYLAYEKPPDEQHSIFMVICSDVNKSLNIYNLIAASRVGTQVKKKILLAIVSPGTILPYYLEMNWWKGDGSR